MVKRLIGTGVTNSNGVATLNKDPNNQTISGYTGTGAGLVDIVAECTVDGSTVVSNSYEVLDAIFYDAGDNTNWYNNGDRFEVTAVTDGKKLKQNSSSNYGNYIANQQDTTSTPFATDTCFEFETSTTGAFRLYIRNGTSKYISIPTGDKAIKVLVSDSKIRWWVDGVEQNPNTPMDFNTDNFRVYFFCSTYEDELTFTNFRAYPI